MAIKLYFMSASPPARAVLVALRSLNIPYELHQVNLVKGEHMTNEFLKLNPQHTIPVIVEDDGFVICDSHAINAYLVGKYAQDDKLYPKDLRKRSVIDHRLHFENGELFQTLRQISAAFVFEGTVTGTTEKITNKFESFYEMVEKYLNTSKFIAGDELTIADWSFLTTFANTGLFVPINSKKFPKLQAYIDAGYKTIPFLEELNKAGIKELKEIFKDFPFLKSPIN